MRKTIIGYSVLMALGLALAFYASRDRGNDANLAQEWVSIDPADIDSVTYEAADANITVRALPDKAGYWVDYRREVDAIPANPHENPLDAATKPVGAKTDTPKKTETDQFKADSNATQLVESFKPLRVEREIGDVGKVNLADYGLNGDVAKLSVKKKQGAPFELRLGMRSFGSRNFFAQDTARNKVILVDGTQIDNLMDARARMFERNVTNFDINDARKAEITAGEYHGKWDQTDRDKSGMLVWKDDEEGATPKANYKTWIDKLVKLRVTRYAKDDELAAIKASPELLAVKFGGDRGPLDQLAVHKAEGSEPEAGYWVVSGFLTRPALVAASRLEPVLKDVPNLLKPKK